MNTVSSRLLWRISLEHGVGWLDIANMANRDMLVERAQRWRQACPQSMLDTDTLVSIIGSCAVNDENRKAIYTDPAIAGRVISVVQYAVALHELGHCLHPEGFSPNEQTAELAAWEWALAHAEIWDRQAHEALTVGLEQRLFTPEAPAPDAEHLDRYNRVFAESLSRVQDMGESS